MLLTPGPADPLYAFGAFVADPVVGRLYHRGDEVPLTPKSFKVLMVVLGSRGRLVDREELFRHVWPDTFVEPNNLARNVSMIRKALHERDSDHEYIVTVSGRGYRFVTPVSQISRADFSAGFGPTQPPNTVEAIPVQAHSSGEVAVHAAADAPRGGPARPEDAGRRTWRWSRRPLAIGAMLVLFLGSAGALLVGSLTRPGDPIAQRRLWQLSSAGRLDGEPGWSPDGQSITYSSDRDGSFKIWTQRVSGGSPVQVTSGPDRDWQPSWSPDGRHIAFRSQRDGGGIFVVPIAGGGARRLAGFGYQPAWSPDGSQLLFCEGRDVYTVGLDGTAPFHLASVALSSQTDRCRVAWHPDGRRISAYTWERGGWGFWTVSLAGSPRVLSRIAAPVEQRLAEAELRLGAFAWAPAGDALYFEGRTERTQNVWRIQVNPRTLEWIAGPDRLTTSSGLESGLAVAPGGKRLAFGSRFERTSVWSLPFDPVAGQITGEGEAITPEGANAKILDISPDGRDLVYRVNSRSTDELWIRALDRQADHLRKVEVDAEIIHPRWSRDGTQLAYVRRPANRTQTASVVLLAAHGENEHQVVPVQAPEMVYDWSPDGKSLLVRCRSNSIRSAICRLSLSVSGSRPELHVIASDVDRNLFAAAYSPDGQWVSFIAAPDLSRSTVFISPSTGGPWAAVTDSGDHWFKDLPRWSADGRTLYFLSNRTGFWNLWGRRFGSDEGTPLGEPFQVSHFDTAVRMVGPEVSALQIAITRNRLILPVTQTSGAIWILESIDN